MTKRFYITGMSAVTACGMNLDESWQAIASGQTGIAPIQNEELDSWEYSLGGELKDYQPRKMLPDKKLLKVISRQDVIGINAACQAVDSSGMIAFRDGLDDKATFNDKTGVYVASPGNKYCQQYDFLPLIAQSKGDMPEFANGLFQSVHPMWLLRILPNNVLAYTGITYDFKGANHNITNHAVSSLQAINEACHAIEQGVIDRAVVIGYDLGLEPQGIMNYSKIGIISKTGLKPFDYEHDGTVLAEGAAAIVIESESSVQARNAQPIVEVMTGLTAIEEGGLFNIEPDGATLTHLIENTLNKHQLTAADIGMVTAHGNGNPLSDNTEAMAFSKVFANNQPPVTSFKWAVGHTIAAAGIIDTVLTAKSLQTITVPGIANFNQPSNESQSLSVSASAQALINPHALVLNRGFGAMDASVMLKAYV